MALVRWLPERVVVVHIPCVLTTLQSFFCVSFFCVSSLLRKNHSTLQRGMLHTAEIWEHRSGGATSGKKNAVYTATPRTVSS